MADQTVAVVDWISAATAAEILGISKRRVLEYVQAGALESRRQRDVETRQIAVQVRAGSVERLREEREHPTPQAPQAIARQYKAGARKSADRAASQGLISARRDADRTAPHTAGLTPSELRCKLWLTADEAVRYTGLGAGYIARRLEPGRIGPRGARVWRRTDLEAL